MKIQNLTVSHLLAFMAGSVIFIASWAVDALLGGISVFRIFLAGTLLLFVAAGLLSGNVRKVNPAEVGLLLFLLWTVLTYFWSIQPELTAIIIQYRYAPAVIMFMVAYRVSLNVNLWRFLGYTYHFGCVVGSMLVIINAASFVAQGERATIGELNANYVAYALASSIPVTLALLSTKRLKRTLRLVLIGSMGLAVFATMSTGSRGALLAEALCLSSFFITRASRNLSKAMIWATTAGLAIFFAWNFLPEDIRSRLEVFTDILSSSSSEVSLSGREDVWPIAMQLFKENLIAGIGAGAFIGVNPYEIAVHNVFLTIATETGIIGVFLYVATVAYIFYRLLFKSRTSEIKSVGLAALVTWVPIAMTGVWEGSVVAWLVFGWLLAASRHDADRSVISAERKRRRRMRIAW